jgi:RND family efflux transporter MFP subunit
MHMPFLKLFRHSVTIAVTVVVLIMGVLTIGCTMKKPTNVKTESIADIQKREGVPVRVVVAERRSLSIYEIAGGTAEGYFQTTLTAGMPGTITAVNVHIGDNVKADSSLMRIEPNTPQNYTIAKEQYDNAAKSRERVATLAKEGGVSQEIIDQIDAGYNSAKEGLSIVRKNQFVIAPFSGTVINIFETVNSTVNPGTELIIIADIKKIKIPITVSDLLVNKFKKGQVAYALIDGDSIEGRIDRVPLSGNENTHTFQIDAVFENPGRLIKPGMYLNVKIVVNEKRDVITLPMDGIITEGDHRSAFVIDSGIARKVTLATGVRSSDIFEITDGITEGTSVAVSGASLLSDGIKVKVVQ